MSGPEALLRNIGWVSMPPLVRVGWESGRAHGLKQLARDEPFTYGKGFDSEHLQAGAGSLSCLWVFGVFGWFP